VIGGLGIDFTLIKEVARDEHKVDAPLNSVTLKHFAPGLKKIQGAVG